MKAKISVKSAHGSGRIYPVNEAANLCLEILSFRDGHPKTFSLRKLELFVRLGIEFEIVECDKTVDSKYLCAQIESMIKGAKE